MRNLTGEDMEKRYHIACDEYLAIDVFKGFCILKKIIVLADEEGCEQFDQAKKCGFCKHFISTEEYLGVCMGKDIAYSGLSAKTCSDFEWKEK
jgi:hypothetical protein